MIKVCHTTNKEGNVTGLDLNSNNSFMKYINNYFCKFNHPIAFGYRNNPTDRYRLYKKNDIEHLTVSVPSYNHKEDMGYAYTHNFNMKTLDKIDFVVNYETGDRLKSDEEEHLYNLFSRPKSVANDSIEDTCEEFFNYLLEIICDNNEEVYEMVLKWISYIFQRGKSGIALVLKGDKRIDKGVFKQCLIKLLTTDYVYVDECGNRIGARFNSIEHAKLIGWFEEVLNNNGDFHMKNELMKKKLPIKTRLLKESMLMLIRQKMSVIMCIVRTVRTLWEWRKMKRCSWF